MEPRLGDLLFFVLRCSVVGLDPEEVDSQTEFWRMIQ